MSAGASPTGIERGDERAAARKIREMFGRVAPRYDLLNRLLSARIDVRWRRRLVKRLRPWLERPDLRYLDLCCGTGDVLLALEQERRRLLGGRGGGGFGSDFCRPMLAGAAHKLARHGLHTPLVEADALEFPLPDGSVDLITIAFGYRNLTNYERGLGEFRRLLRPGGCLAVLEFSQPRTPIWGPLFGLYFRHVLPRIGGAISGAGDAYSYLQRSVEAFPSPEQTSRSMLAAGFEAVPFERLTGGVACLHLAKVGNSRG